MADNERLRKALTKFVTLFPNTTGQASLMGEALLAAHEALAVTGNAVRAAGIDLEDKK